MAFEDRNAAYNLELFQESTSPRKREVPEKPAKKRKAKQKQGNKIVVIPNETLDRIGRRKVNPVKIVATALFGGMIAFLLIVNISGRVALTELNQKIINTQEELVEQQSIYTQTELSVNAMYSTVVVEEYAKNQLNMSRATNSQKEFVSLSEGDKAEVMEADEQNIFVRVVNAIKEILS